MTTVGSFEAQNLLPQLLRASPRARKFSSPRAASPWPSWSLRSPQQADVRNVIAEFKAYSRRQARTLGDLGFREMIDEGRRY